MIKKRLKHAYLFISIPIVLLAISACGLPTYIYLYPPIGFSSPSANRLEIDHNLNNYDSSEGLTQSFKGYEIYYRAYDDYQTAQNDLTLLASIAASTSYSDYPSRFRTYAEDTRKFVRLRLDVNNSPPLISIPDPSIDDVKYLINLNPDSDWKLNDGINDIAILARQIDSQDFSSRYHFNSQSNYQSGDTDYAGSSNPTKIYFDFFAIAFGNDSFENVYSEPAIITSPIEYVPGLP